MSKHLIQGKAAFVLSPVAALLALSMASNNALAAEIPLNSSDWSLRLDNTAKLNYGNRIEKADAAIAGTANFNDGNLNFDKGTVSKRADLFTELDLVYQDKWGVRLSSSAWYDAAYKNVSAVNPFPGQKGNAGHLIAARTTAVAPGVTVPPGTILVPAGGQAVSSGLNDFADRYYRGFSGELLDGFVFFNSQLNDDMLLSVKAGRHTVFWGETLLNPVNGINFGQSALDLGKLYTVPGTEAKELFMPRTQLSTSLILNEEWSVAAQYFFEFRNSRFPESGTFMGPYDMALDGAQVFWLPLASVAALGGQSAFYGAPRGEDVKPDDSGDFGLMAKWSPEWLDGTMGFYYRNTSDTLPFFLVDAPNLHNPGLAGLPGLNYFATYGSDIDLYGLSLSKSLGDMSLGLDLNYRQNMPLASNFTTINSTLAGLAQAGVINGTNLIAGKPAEGDTGLATGDTFHLVANGMLVYADSAIWDGAVLLAEMAMTHLVDVNSNEHTFKGHSSYQGVDKVTSTAWTLALNFTPTWYQAIAGVDLSMPMSINGGLAGHSAIQFGGNKHAGSFAVGLSADYRMKYKFDLKYVDAFGAYQTCETGTDNNTSGANGAYQCIPGQITSQAGLAPLLKDRGVITASFKTTF